MTDMPTVFTSTDDVTQFGFMLEIHHHPLVLFGYPTRLFELTLTAKFAFPAIIFGKQIRCTQLSHHASC